MALGEKVRGYRLARGWTQQELANRAGMSQPTLQKLEARDQSKSRYAANIAKALGVPLEALLSDTNNVEMRNLSTDMSDEAARLLAELPSALQTHFLEIIKALAHR